VSKENSFGSQIPAGVKLMAVAWARNRFRWKKRELTLKEKQELTAPLSLTTLNRDNLKII